MQQNVRIALRTMESEIRMAGFDSTEAAGAGIVNATAVNLQFTRDLDSNGDVTGANEDITYSRYDFDGDGQADLVRNDVNGLGANPVALNCDALDFVYLDEDGAVTASLPDIRMIQVSIVIRTSDEDYSYTNSDVYQNIAAIPVTIYTAPTDNFRRRLLSSHVICRNLGL